MLVVYKLVMHIFFLYLQSVILPVFVELYIARLVMIHSISQIGSKLAGYSFHFMGITWSFMTSTSGETTRTIVVPGGLPRSS